MPTGPSPTLPIPGDSTTQIILAVASNRPMPCPLEIRDWSSHPFSPTEVNDTAKLLESRYSVGPFHTIKHLGLWSVFRTSSSLAYVDYFRVARHTIKTATIPVSEFQRRFTECIDRPVAQSLAVLRLAMRCRAC